MESQSQALPTPRNSTRKYFNAPARWRLAAVAATLVLLLGSGYFQSLNQGPAHLDQVSQLNQVSHLNQVTVNEESVDSSSGQTGTKQSLLRGLNQAISDLASAQILDPDNLKLTRLSLLAHKSRANFLRVGTRR